MKVESVYASKQKANKAGKEKLFSTFPLCISDIISTFNNI